MRIGIDCRLWNESGVGRYTRNLVKHLLLLDKKNSYIFFVLPRDKEDIKYQISKIKNNWKLEIGNWKLTSADVRWHTLEEQFKFPPAINRENLDLMHFPYFSVPIFYNKPYIVTIHDLILHHFPTGLASTLPGYLYKLKLLGYKFVIKKAAQKAKKIITVSNATKNEIVDHLSVPKDKVVVTYEGIEVSSKFKVQSSKLQLKVKSYFLYVGNAYPHKNLDRLVQAFSLLCYPERSEGTRDSSATPQNDIKMVLVGKEDYFYNNLKEKTKNLGLEKSVIFLGEVSDGELVSLYKNAKAFIVPSLMEGFGLPGLEAMANKCLVLASDIPAFHEVYGNAAEYFNPFDVNDISKKMIESLKFKENFNQVGFGLDRVRRGLERAKMFSWEKMAKETLKIYKIKPK